MKRLVLAAGLVAMVVGGSVERVVRFRLDAPGNAVTGAEVLRQDDPRFSAPTTAAIAGRRLYVVANSLLDRLGEDGALPPPDRLEEPLVLALELGSPVG